MWTDNESLSTKLSSYKEGFQLWSQNSQSIETLYKAGSALEHAQMSWPLPIKLQLGTRVSQKVGPQAKTTMTLLICLSSFYDPDVCAGGLNYHCSRLFLSFCHILYVAQAEPRSEARRNDFSVPCVYCTLFELWFEWCFYLMYVFESATACCEPGVDVVMTTSKWPQVTTA